MESWGGASSATRRAPWATPASLSGMQSLGHTYNAFVLVKEICFMDHLVGTALACQVHHMGNEAGP